MIRSGERFVVTYTLLDSSVPPHTVDVEAHLHIFVNGRQVSILRRSSGEVAFVGGAYRVEPLLRVSRGSLVEFRWHFPEIEFWSELTKDWIEGPEPTEVVG